MSKIQSGYFLDTKGKLHYAENYYDEYCCYEDFNEGLNVYSNDCDHCSFGDGKDYNSIESLFRRFVNDGQYNVIKLAKAVELTPSDYAEYDWADNDICDEIEAGTITEIEQIPENELKEYFAERYPDIARITANFFTNKNLFAENFPYYSTGISMRNYSCAGPTYWDTDNMDDSREPDAVIWIDRATFEEWGTAEEIRFESLENSISNFQNWANGECYGLVWRDWDEEKDCWTEEESCWGYISDDFSDLEILLTQEYEPTETENVRRPFVKTYKTIEEMNKLLDKLGLLKKKPFDVELNDGVLFGRERA